MSSVELTADGHVTTVTLNRPEALNAISGEMADELGGAVLQAAADPACWVVLLTAAGEKAFCVGADLKERGGLDDAGWMRNRVQMRGLFESLRAVPQPTIAGVFGFALGGGFELALSCDFIVCSDDTQLGLPEVRVGIIPGGGGTQLVSRRIGTARAKDLVLTGRRLSSQEALSFGLVQRVVPRSELGTATRELAEELCRNAPVSLREAKHAIDRGIEVPLDHGIDIEDAAWRRAVASADRREGIAAFNEKRDPDWKGR
ncbi:MAG: enoyl-CoA hydratase/isomerase family protein [Actinomycetota bacterium]